jgi:hypothetical protein
LVAIYELIRAETKDLRSQLRSHQAS